MARNRGKKALYEVMSKARAKPGYGRTLEQLHAKRTDEKNRPVTDREPVADRSRTVPGLWKKPKIVQVVAGRIEFSMPYQIAIAFLLVLILVILAVYRLGQFSGSADTQSASMTLENEPRIQPQERTEQPAREALQPAVEPPGNTDLDTQAVPVSTGDNVIVITQYNRHADLVPVKEHFDKYDVETEILMKNGVYFLRTKNKYENPGRPGTDGYNALQRIIQVGAEYKGKAPEGFETFAPHYFSDAYGMKVED